MELTLSHDATVVTISDEAGYSPDVIADMARIARDVIVATVVTLEAMQHEPDAT